MRTALVCFLGLSVGCSSSETPDSTDTTVTDVSDTQPETTTDVPDVSEDVLVDTSADTSDGLTEDTETPDTSTGDTIPGDTGDTGAADTTVDTSEVEDTHVGETCPTAGRYEFCTLACGPYQVPMRQCLGGTWDECACLTFTSERLAEGGAPDRAGYVDTGADGRYACFSRGAELMLAHNLTGTWTVSSIGVDGVDCDLSKATSGGALLAYGAKNSPERGHSLFYRTVDNGVLGAATIVGNTPNYRGVGPQLAQSPGGEIHGISVEERNAGPSLRTYQLVEGTTQNLEDLQGPPFDQAVTVCDDGTPLIAWADMATDMWISYIGARVGTSWRSKFISWEVQFVGAGLALDCKGGRAYGLMQDFSQKVLVFFTSPTPADPASYLSYELPTDEPVGGINDIQVDGGVVWASWVTTSGDVRLSVRPADLSAEWTTFKVVDRGQLSTGLLGGDVVLTVGPDGRPSLMFFGVTGVDAGPWTATLR